MTLGEIERIFRKLNFFEVRSFTQQSKRFEDKCKNTFEVAGNLFYDLEKEVTHLYLRVGNDIFEKLNPNSLTQKSLTELILKLNQKTFETNFYYE